MKMMIRRKEDRNTNQQGGSFGSTVLKVGIVGIADSGVSNKQLRIIVGGKGSAASNIISITRAKFTLSHRTGTDISSPTKGKGFYPFEEDLPHHI